MADQVHLVDDLDGVPRSWRNLPDSNDEPFEATNHSEAVVPADREAIWAALTDPDVLPRLTRCSATSTPTATCGAGT
jgi:hypothetical protein